LSAVDRTYGGRYAILERVGTGGMAEVYRARDELLGRDVAVKVLSERFSRDRSFVERFRREAQAAANLNHPNIVSLFDYGSDDDTYFIVMEFIDGSSLSDIIRREGALMPERAAEIASDVARALDRAHAQSLVHRDIKSGNIMITRTGQTKVTDFGIARAVGRDGEQTMTQTGMVIGTASYLSPEQAQGNPVDGRSDVYSLGVVLFEMLTGRTPFSGDTALSIAYKHVREDPPPPSELNRDVPAQLDAVTLKALAKNPDNRYSSAAEMSEDLQRFMHGQKVQATPILADQTAVMGRGTGTQVLPPTDIPGAKEPSPRRAGWYVVIALLALGLVGLLVWLLADNLFGGAEVRVPNVVGMTEREARDELDARGLRTTVEDRRSRRPVGEVIDQDPAADATAREGDTVTITVSRGPRQVEVPDLTGRTQEEAEALLDDAGLRRGEVSEETSDEFDEGQVIRQDPAAGQEVNARSRVDIVLSAGPESVIVPPVVGLSEEDARSAIQGAGLEVDVIREPSDSPQGEVTAQDPEARSEVPQGDTVTITVSEGPQGEPMPNVVGQDADDAQDFLEDEFGLTVSREAETEPCAQPPGTVCRQDPSPGTEVSEGDTVTIFVQGG
jgi:beta-lactam-binding protein with PASTA domain/tRNA A-37 threonylcarbamoyl transferase component Bud32